MNGRAGTVLSRVYLGAVILFVFAPILASFVFSFNSDRFPIIPHGSFTFHWYETAFSNPDVWDGFRTSLIVAVSEAVNRIACQLISEGFVGASVILYLEAPDGSEIKAQLGEVELETLDLAPGATLWVSWEPEAAHLMPGENG